ncbi:hypothetical protein MTR_2g084825 [Medicago truncatula]|uniref:Transmembrane protein n=2 Tax=Medicago truncatula TaxID=3880 RepID=A0A072VBH6_MEDTR|nr:hypothetical protein MTR_2g084825 [Medicago truncatula]
MAATLKNAFIILLSLILVVTGQHRGPCHVTTYKDMQLNVTLPSGSSCYGVLLQTMDKQFAKNVNHKNQLCMKYGAILKQYIKGSVRNRDR